MDDLQAAFALDFLIGSITAPVRQILPSNRHRARLIEALEFTIVDAHALANATGSLRRP